MNHCMMEGDSGRIRSESSGGAARRRMNGRVVEEDTDRKSNRVEGTRRDRDCRRYPSGFGGDASS